MMNKLVFGRHMPGDSLIHRLDPRARLLISFYFAGVIFLVSNWGTYFILAAFTLFSVFLSKVDLKFFTRGVRPLTWLILLTIALQILFTSEEETYQSWGVLHITEFGVMNGLFIFCRSVLIISMSTLLMFTIPLLESSDAIRCLLRPLRAVRFPIHEISSILSIALHFVPILMDEIEKIMNAQHARDVDSGGGNLVQKMKAVIPLLIPLLVSNFDRVEDLATAMEARGYKGREGRMKYRVSYQHNRGMVVIIAFILLTVLLIFLRG